MKNWISDKDFKKSVESIRMEHTVRQRILANCRQRYERRWYKKKSFRGAILLSSFVLLFLCSPAAAQVRQTLEMWIAQMTEQDIEDIYNSAQKSQAPADSTSRELSWDEKIRKDQLRELYKKDGLFPAGQITVLKNGAKPVPGAVCYDEVTSVWYLPSTELTDEQLLEIIDYTYKMDYSLKTINESLGLIEIPEATEAAITEDEALEAAKKLIKSAYQVEIDPQRIFVEKNQNGDYTVKYTGLECENGYIENCFIEIMPDTEKVSHLIYIDRDYASESIPADGEFDEGRWYQKGKDILSQTIGDFQLKNGYYMAYRGETAQSDISRRIHYFYELTNGDTYHFGFLYDNGILQTLSLGESFSENMEYYKERWDAQAKYYGVSYKNGQIE